ncbi:hypothetical protein LTR62_004820 [Meristemomyces frigidus]|uniref:Integral membrane protein n=1 Tax=Meristemomyces frigidus TaxID=1508187 RepID=A0AAN7YFS9_9PEZI|nr:hypothetical protein LTR62_004820 [Meristemomyces frigidus]
MIPLLLTAALVASTTAQLLTNGNSQFPSCASSCPLLNQAAQACGGTTTATTQIWSCFCQSAYLRTLYTSPAGICDSVCTNPSDNQQVMSWYTTNCGTDLGASEHANDAGGGATTVVVTSTSTSAGAATGTSGASQSTSTSNVGSDGPVIAATSGKSWWSAHYNWVIMLIVLFIGLSLLALVVVYLKRRHDRKQDVISGGFNAGITSRSAPIPASGAGMTSVNNSAMMLGGLGSARESMVDHRLSNMPYGYGNGSRNGSRMSAAHANGWSSPLARGGTPSGDVEKQGGGGMVDGIAPGKRQKRVLVRERSVEGLGSPGVEKDLR